MVGDHALPPRTPIMRHSLALALLSLVLAGCVGAPDPDAQQTASGATSDGAIGEGTDDGLTPIGRAVLRLQEGRIEGSWSFEYNWTNHGTAQAGRIFLDDVAHVVVMSAPNDAPGIYMLVNRTTISGNAQEYGVIHDARATPFAGLASVRDATPWDPRLLAIDAGALLTPPSQILDEELDGTPATRYTIPGNPTYGLPGGVGWIEKAPTARLLGYDVQSGGEMHKVRLQYGERTLDPRVAEVRHLEGIAFYEGTDLNSVMIEVIGSQNHTWTLADTETTNHPSLSGMQVNASYNGGAVALPLDQTGSKEDEHVRLTFTDVDADGRLTPGDTLRAEALGRADSLGAFDIVVELANGARVKLL